MGGRVIMTWLLLFWLGTIITAGVGLHPEDTQVNHLVEKEIFTRAGSGIFEFMKEKTVEFVKSFVTSKEVTSFKLNTYFTQNIIGDEFLALSRSEASPQFQDNSNGR